MWGQPPRLPALSEAEGSGGPEVSGRRLLILPQRLKLFPQLATPIHQSGVSYRSGGRTCHLLLASHLLF